MTERLFVRWISAAAVCFLIAVPAWGQDAAPELPDESQVRGPLPAESLRAIDAFVGYWLDQLDSAKTADEIMKARQGLVSGYERHSTAYYQLAYAEAVAKVASKALATKDRVKQIQAAMAMAVMSQVSIQPALEKMAGHSNAAVRYWAVIGYQRAARALMLRGGAFSKTMLDTLERLGLKESNGPIVGTVMRALAPYPEARAQDVRDLRACLDKIWLGRCREILAGKAEIIDAYRNAERSSTPVNAEDGKHVLQMLADAMEAATLAYTKPENRRDPVAESLTNLLAGFEVKLAQVIGVTETPLQPILKEATSPGDKAAAVRLKWNEHWKPLLKQRGVTPRVSANSATTATGTSAATAPAGT